MVMVMMATVMIMIMVGMVMVTMVMMIVMMAMGMMMVMTHCSKLSRLLATWGSKSQAQAHRLLGSNCLPMRRLVTHGNSEMAAAHSYQPHHGVAGIHAAMIRQCNRRSHSTHGQWHSHNSSKGLLTSMQQSHPPRRRPLQSSSRE